MNSEAQLAAAAVAMANGMAAAAAHAAWSEQTELTIGGSDVVVDPAAQLDDIAVTPWPG
jgi:hypothetical protein